MGVDGLACAVVDICGKTWCDLYVILLIFEKFLCEDDVSYFVLKMLYVILAYTGCPRRNGPNFGRVFLMLNYTDITQNTYIQS